MAIARRIRINECRANFCQYPKIKNSGGTMHKQINASCQSIISIITMMPTRLSKSEKLCTISSKVSCNCNTSLWLRDIIRPTGVR